MPHRDRTLNYVEIGVPDVAAAKAFYANVFGWTFTDYGPDYSSFAATDAGLDGGFWKSDTPATPATKGRVLLVLYAGEIEAMQQRIESAGGTIIRPTFTFPGGRRFHFTDPSGNELAVWSE